MVLLPIWGFLVGFTFGANAIFYIAGADHGFFADALAIVSGLVVGVLFAVVGEHERSRRIATKDAEAIGVSGA